MSDNSVNADEQGPPGKHAGTGRELLFAWLSCLPLALFGALIVTCFPAIAAGETIRISYEWVPSLGINFSFYIDGLSLTFALLISGIGFFIWLYTSSYLAGHKQLGRFYCYLLLFMIAMMGIVLSDNLITLFVFWELTTVSSYLLIGFDHTSDKARRSALQALFVTGAGGLALLAGLILIGMVGGTYELSEIIARGDVIKSHDLYTPILILVLIGAFTKSAQIPFHFWLPNAMAAPTPVSAYLHSATMVKAGIYLLARFHPALSGTDMWIWTLTIFGAVTAVTASVFALRQTDLKLMLAYTTVMALGTLTMFLGAEATVAIAAAMTFLIVHSFYKAALFMIIGIIDHETGTRDVNSLRGLARVMPITAVAAAAAALSMAGFPPFLGFIGKELKYEGALAIASEPVVVATAAILANALMVAAAGIVAVRPFFGTAFPTPKTPHEAPVRLWIGPLVLASLGLTFGLVPSLIGHTMVQPAVTAILGRPETVKLALWHGINVPLMLSILTFVLGIGLFAIHQRFRQALIRIGNSVPINADKVWDQLLDGLKCVAGWQTRILQNGILHHYLFVLFATFALVIGASLYLTGAMRLPDQWPRLLAKEWAIVALIASAAVVTLFARTRLGAVCTLGVVGVGVAIVFLMFGAPDVAITQLLVETLFVVLIAVVMLRLPGFRTQQRERPRLADGVLAIIVGSLMTLIVLAVIAEPIDRSITEYFEKTSVPEAFGRNIVNVILVDFRAMDTFGEIAVVVIAAIGAVALIRRAGRRTMS